MLPICVESYWNTPIYITTQLAPIKASTNNLPFPVGNLQPKERYINEKYSVASSTITTEYLHLLLFSLTEILVSQYFYAIDLDYLFAGNIGNFSYLEVHFLHSYRSNSIEIQFSLLNFL